MGINTHGSFTVMAVFTRLSIQFVFPRQKKPPDPPETKHGRPIWPLWLAWQLDGPERRNLYVAANFNARRPVTCSRKLSSAWYCAITMADRYALSRRPVGRGPGRDRAGTRARQWLAGTTCGPQSGRTVGG